jgi:H+/Cl- antiporter ClcA
MAPALESVAIGGVHAPADYEPVDARVVVLCSMALGVGLAGGLAAHALMALIGAVTNLAYYGRLSTVLVSPAANALGAFAIGIPVLGALVVGLMARFGSSAIRGHGIPEVMERVLYAESRIPLRLLFLKPLSAAIAIGTGGPFGAEGPIIATGGALGSMLGQLVRVTADERKTLLAAGAAAGMAGTFGSPVSAVLLAVELLLFEYRPRSLVPVTLAAAVATGVRLAFEGPAPMFLIPDLAPPSAISLVGYAALGAAVGALAVGCTRLVYGLEDLFARLPIHWMWWPALGAVVVGLVGMVEPRTLGVGYDNITGALAGTLTGRALLLLVVLKLVSWSVYLSSGTSGGTLAPLFTIGAGVGAWTGALVASAAPGLSIDPHMAGLVGMAALFAGASHAMLTSVVFAFETTRQPLGLLPLLTGCAAAYLVSLLLGRHSIMTEKLARRGARVQSEYSADHLSQLLVRDAASREVVTLKADECLDAVRSWLASGALGTSHQGFPVLDAGGDLVGVVTRRDLFDPSHAGERSIGSVIRRRPAVVYDDSTLRDAADHMVLGGVGRLPVVTRARERRVIGIVTRSDLLAAHASRLRAARTRAEPRGVGR